MFNALLPSGSRLLRATASMKSATRNSSSLKAILASQMDGKRAALVDMKKKYGHVSLGEVVSGVDTCMCPGSWSIGASPTDLFCSLRSSYCVLPSPFPPPFPFPFLCPPPTPPSPSSFGQTVDQAIGGARGVKCMLWETSLLDADEGIRFRGHTIPDLQKSLPTYSGKQEDEPLPEALIWLLLTGEVPTAAQTQELTDDLHKRAQLPAHVEPMIRAFPDNMHPMTQLSAAILACQTESQFAKAYSEGASKMDYWETTLEDSLNLMAQLPEIAALIYRCKFHDGKVAAYDASLDYSANFCRMLGYNDPKFDELMRLYLGKCDGSGELPPPLLAPPGSVLVLLSDVVVVVVVCPCFLCSVFLHQSFIPTTKVATPPPTRHIWWAVPCPTPTCRCPVA